MSGLAEKLTFAARSQKCLESTVALLFAAQVLKATPVAETSIADDAQMHGGITANLRFW